MISPNFYYKNKNGKVNPCHFYYLSVNNSLTLVARPATP